VGKVARALGCTDEATTAYARQIRSGFSTHHNIIRDVGEDRIYLPVNELQQFDVKHALNREYLERFTFTLSDATRAEPCNDAVLPGSRRTGVPRKCF
jgi:phytoene synthase